ACAHVTCEILQCSKFLQGEDITPPTHMRYADLLWVNVFNIVKKEATISLRRHCVKAVPALQAGPAVTHQRLPHERCTTLAGTRHQKIHRNGEVDALVEAALSELRGGNIGLGGKCTHGHAIAEQAGDVERHTPITGQVASGRGRHVYPALLAKIVIKGGVPGGDAIVPEREALIIVALLDPVGVKAKGPGSIQGAIEQFAAYAAEHALQQSHVAHSKSVAS